MKHSHRRILQMVQAGVLVRCSNCRAIINTYTCGLEDVETGAIPCPQCGTSVPVKSAEAQE